MLYVAMFHWGWLLGALLLGFGAGWISVVQRGGVSRTTARWLMALVAMLVVAALVRIVPGRAGYWLDLGLVMFALYLVGCTIGSCLRGWVVYRHRHRRAA